MTKRWLKKPSIGCLRLSHEAGTPRLDKIVQAAADAHESRIEHAHQECGKPSELNRLLSNREDSEKGLGQLLEAVAQESDCDSAGRRHNPVIISSDSPLVEDASSCKRAAKGSTRTPGPRTRCFRARATLRLGTNSERLLIHPLLLPGISDGDPEIIHEPSFMATEPTAYTPADKGLCNSSFSLVKAC